MSEDPHANRFLSSFRNTFDRRRSGRESGNGFTALAETPRDDARPANGSTSSTPTLVATPVLSLTPLVASDVGTHAQTAGTTPLTQAGHSAIVDESALDVDSSSGVHAITKKTDFWFEREVGVIEKQAVEWADAWAQKGLPRHDVLRTEPLEPEQVLAKRCSQTLREWQLRVRTKMQDAIEKSSQLLGEHVAILRTRVARLEVISHELAERGSKIEKIRTEVAAAGADPVRYTAFVPNWVFWICAVLLAGVEFFANFPLFRLLLPMETALEKAAASAAENVNDSSLFAGVELFARNLFWNVEAGVVAFVAVIVLVLLGKQLGKSLRPIAVLRETDHPLASRSVRAHRAQHRVAAAMSFVGLACVVTFLALSRGQIAQTAESRVSGDHKTLAATQLTLSAAQANRDRGTANDAFARRQAEEEALHRHEDAAAYAKTVQLNNFPIFLLNIGLIATAAMLGFGNAHADLGEGKGEHPDLVKLRDRCNELRRDMVLLDAQARDVVGHAYGAIGHVQHLLRAHPMRGWESKLRRLEGVIPLFRGENARRRGLDPANIRAFDMSPELELPTIDEALAFSEPAEFSRLTAELEALLARLASTSASGVRSRDQLPTT
jgi:hypothetical protein